MGMWGGGGGGGGELRQIEAIVYLLQDYKTTYAATVTSLKAFANGLLCIFRCVMALFWYAVTAINVVSGKSKCVTLPPLLSSFIVTITRYLCIE